MTVDQQTGIGSDGQGPIDLVSVRPGKNFFKVFPYLYYSRPFLLLKALKSHVMVESQPEKGKSIGVSSLRHWLYT